MNASQYSLTLGSVFSIDATARPGHTTAELEKAIDEELAKLATTPPSEDELTRARNTLRDAALPQPREGGRGWPTS